MFPDCSLCSEGYVETLAFRCSKCSDGKVAVSIVIVAFVILVALAFVWQMVSIAKKDTTRGIVASLGRVLPLQSIKIIVVVWQIVTQVSSREMLKSGCGIKIELYTNGS